MCGIAGLFQADQPLRADDFTRMRDSLAHRGPDDAHSELFENAHLALGHRRLSFLDLSPAGRQPLSNEDQSVWIVFNGEIYNYLELRGELQASGHTFHTRTDTEVIVHGYEEWGQAVLGRLKGMFAFGLLDLNRKRIWLARDRFGIKPLYYTCQPGLFAFASELKSFVASDLFKMELDISSVADYLAYRYVPSPKTIWKGFSKLPPAHSLTYEYKTGRMEMNEYWKIPFAENDTPSRKLVANFGTTLADSISLHARSDVPVGSFLSGGYDSSAIVQYLAGSGHRPETFSIGFEGWPESEHQYAAKVAETFGVPLHHELADETSLDLLEIMSDVYDEPIADISIIPTWLVSRMAARNVKAVMSGEGADELLGGYWWQKKIVGMQLEQNWMARFIQKFRKPGFDTVEYYADAMAMGRFDQREMQRAFEPAMHQYLPEDPDWFYRRHFNRRLSPLKSIQQMDIKCFMGELVLVKIDRASMAHSLEVRVPFLDHDLFQQVLGSKASSYFRSDVTKYLLHENIRDKMPDLILNRSKQGFVGPLDFYEDMARYHAILDDCRICQEGIIRREYVEELFVRNDNWRLWKLAILEKWYARWVK